MTLLCKIFGHRPAGPGWWGDIPYMKIKQAGTDGVNRIHCTAHHECERCGTEYLAGRLHLNSPVITRANREYKKSED